MRQQTTWWIFVTFLVYMAVMAPQLQALSLSGRPLSPLSYYPGTTIVNQYSIGGAAGEIEVLVSGDVFSDITVSEVVDNRFDLIINFPAEEQVPSGSYAIGLTVREIPEPGNAISSAAAVSKVITVIVYSYEKDIQAGLTAPNINQGSKVAFQLGVSSSGYPDIEEVYGIITVRDANGREVGQLTTEKKPLPGLGSISFTPQFDSSSLPAARYDANATVFYDGNRKYASASFLIGNMDVLVTNYTSELPQGFAEFRVMVKNNWGNPLRNVYARLLLNETELLQTPTIALGPWEEASLSAIAKFDLAPGSYDAVLRLFFEGEQKDVPLRLKILSPAPEIEKQVQEVKSIWLVPAAITIIIILLAIATVLWRVLWRKSGKSGRSGPRETDEI